MVEKNKPWSRNGELQRLGLSPGQKRGVQRGGAAVLIGEGIIYDEFQIILLVPTAHVCEFMLLTSFRWVDTARVYKASGSVRVKNIARECSNKFSEDR